ncbi:MAG: ParA family protein [bacterium]
MGDNNDPRDVESGNQDWNAHLAGNENTASSNGTSQLKRRTPWDTLSARVISLVSRKGGVGKTTTAVNLGAALALSDHSVLLVGVDPQCGVARSLGYGPDDLHHNLRQIFDAATPLTHLTYTTPLKNLFFVTPFITTLQEEENYTTMMQEQVDTFVREIDRARNLYDTIIIDCPPGLNPFTRGALLASDSYLVPVQAEELCRDSIGPLLKFVNSFRDQVYPEADRTGDRPCPLALEGMFVTMLNNRTRMSKHVLSKLSEDHADVLFDTAVPRTTRLTEMALRGKPAVIYDRKSPGSRAYFDLGDELLLRYVRQNGQEPVADKAVTTTDELTADELTTEAVLPSTIDNMEQLLTEMRAEMAESEEVSATPPLNNSPEMVSLDDLLAEEEQRAGEPSDWDEPVWNLDPDQRGRFN